MSLAFAAVLAAGTLTASADTGQRSGQGRTYFVDCAHGDDTAPGTSPLRPWRSLARVSSATFGPGDHLWFRRGTSCDGTLAPKGSGTVARPITVGAYGWGAKPRISAHGALAAVLLRDVQGWELRDLDVSNLGATPPGQTELRIGIYVLLEDYGIGHHYRVENVDVHDVNGCDCRNPWTKDVSGGIIFKAGGTVTPTGYDDILVRRNTIKHVDRQGVTTSSDWERRAQYPNGRGTTYVPMTRVRIVDNYAEDLGGDGMGVYNGRDALIAGNIVHRWAVRAPSYTAAMGSFNTDGAIIRGNEVTGGQGTGAIPSAAFMLEHANLDTVFEYNYSSGNKGGAFIVCADPGRPTDRSVFRYNISQNDDSDGWFPAGPNGEYKAAVGVVTEICADAGHIQVYGNTFYTTVAERMIANYTRNAVEFSNNIVVGRPAGSTITDPTGQYRHNLFYSVPHPPVGAVGGGTADPLLLAPGTATGRADAGGYRIRAGSPALRAGITVPADGGRDYYGNPVPPREPNIGAYTGRPVREGE